ncbi:MAG: hypothetical protein R3F59_36675 [Myxococcota bacterium]
MLEAAAGAPRAGADRGGPGHRQDGPAAGAGARRRRGRRGAAPRGGDPIEQATPWLAWRRVLAQLGGLPGLQAELGERAAALGALLGQVDAAGPLADRREAVLAAGSAAVAARCARGPVVLAVDDAADLDEPSLALLARVRRTGGLAVVAAARAPPRTARSPPRSATTRGSSCSAAWTTPRWTSSLRAARPARAPGPFVRFVGDKAEGNPLFTEEIAAALVDAGAVRIADGACEVVQPLADVAFPDTVEGIVCARIDRFSPTISSRSRSRA